MSTTDTETPSERARRENAAWLAQQATGAPALAVVTDGWIPPPEEPIDGWTRDERSTAEQASLAGADIAALFPAVNWHEAFSRRPDDVEWLVEPIIERGRSYALYAPAKAGKSLLALEIAAALATGRPVLSSAAREPITVLYVDAENAEADLVERLSAYGYGPDDLESLRYLSFPSFSALDSATGGRQLLAAAEYYEAQVVIIDTTTRFVEGRENDSDTFHNLYRCALAPLKGRGITVIRLDHSGKDEERGQRGSSAKASDVDVVWKLVKTSETALELRREQSRNAHSPELLQLRRRFSPLRHEVVNESGLPAEVEHIVDELHRLGVPVNLGRDRCRESLAAAGVEARNEVLAAAVRHRKQAADKYRKPSHIVGSPVPDSSAETVPGDGRENLSPRSGQFDNNRRSDLSRTGSGQSDRSSTDDLSPPHSHQRWGQVGQDTSSDDLSDRICLYIAKRGGPVGLLEIAEHIGLKPRTVEASLKRLHAAGELTKHPSGPGVPVAWSIAQGAT